MSTDLNEIIDGINSENCTDWLVGYAERLQSEGSNKILVLDINRTDLANEKRDNIKEIGSVEYGDWDGLSSIVGEEETKNLKKVYFDCEDYKETTFAILLYNNFTFVTLIRD